MIGGTISMATAWARERADEGFLVFGNYHSSGHADIMARMAVLSGVGSPADLAWGQAHSKPRSFEFAAY
jgi:hypothetical protein